MSDKKLNAIKEIEFRIGMVKDLCKYPIEEKNLTVSLEFRLEQIDNLLFDINDFINDLKDTDETN